MARFPYSLACSNKFDFKRCPHLCRVQRYTIYRYRTKIIVLYSQEAEITFSKKPAQEGYVYRPKSLWVLTTGTNEAHNWNRLFIPILTIYSMMSPLEFDFWRFFPICHRTKSQEGEATDTSSSHTSAAYEWNRPFNAGMYGATCKKCSCNVHIECRRTWDTRQQSGCSRPRPRDFFTKIRYFVFHKNACNSVIF